VDAQTMVGMCKNQRSTDNERRRTFNKRHSTSDIVGIGMEH